MKLKRKSIIPYKGRVVDLSVSNSHTYNVSGIAVHNSGGGSLVNYVLEIIDLDPIKWELPFSRFLSVHRCLDPKTFVAMTDGSQRELGDIQVGDNVITQDGSSKRVSYKCSTQHEKFFKIKIGDVEHICSENHEWIVRGVDGNPVKKRTFELSTDDILYTFHANDNTKNL